MMEQGKMKGEGRHDDGVNMRVNMDKARQDKECVAM